MKDKKVLAFRGLRKTANLARRTTSKAARFSGRVEQKADRIIHGTDPTVRLYKSVLFEKLHSKDMPEITPIHPSLPLVNRKGYVTILVPSLQKSSFFGGTATALILAGLISKEQGKKIRIVETLQHGGASPRQLSEFFKANAIEIDDENIILIDLSPRKYNHYGYLDIHPEDLYIASAWWDAHLLNQLPLPSKYIYLIQDFEPIFYNNSDKYILAEQTYKNRSFIPVCNTELMYKFMSEKGYEHIKENGIWFEPAVGVKPLTSEKEVGQNTKKRLFIYGRPSVARNLFFFALDSLNELFSEEKLLASEWEVCMAGQDSLSDVILPSGVRIKNLGKMNIDEYYKLVQGTDLAISPMMAPHPNYPTLEFASAGAAVVTTAWETKINLSNYSNNIFVSELNKEDFKKAIVEASKLDKSTRIINAQRSKIGSNWSDTLSEVVKSVA